MKYIILLLLISNLFPCAVCYGAPDHPVTQGMNNGIMFLLFIVVFVLSSIAGSILVLMKRAKAVEIKRSSK
tara:strand:- start:245 stop:457 length:213 start_codon:yes stop_codon:yes gene_type:complete